MCFARFAGCKNRLYIPFLHPHHVGMSLNAPESPDGVWIHAGENLRRRKSSNVYYIFAKRNGKQFSRSLKTTDKALARRRADDIRRELDRLTGDEAAHVTFDQLAVRWNESEKHALKESTFRRREASVKAIAPFFQGLQIRNIRPSHCEDWLTKRGQTLAPATFVKELETMRGVFRYAVEQGLILRDPSASIKRPRVRNESPDVPTREQFEKMVSAIRAESQGKGHDGADLVELLAYSGMRLNEARSLRWRDVNFSGGVFTVTGGERGTKNYEQRTVPLFDEMRAFDSPQTTEQLGSKPKFWFLMKGDKQPWLFKFTREKTGEDWSEKIASEVAKLLKLPAAKVELAVFNEMRGCASRSLVETESTLIRISPFGFNGFGGATRFYGQICARDGQAQWDDPLLSILTILLPSQQHKPPQNFARTQSFLKTHPVPEWK
jgi:site-specific recombinase XerD